MKNFSVIIFFLITSVCVKSQTYDREIKTKWQFKQTEKSEWFPAEVPGNVFIDLLNSKQIKDPYYSDQVNDSRWVEKSNWEYKTVFTCDETILNNQHLELIFEGLDTHAEVFLNDVSVLVSNNMFRKWTIDVKKIIKLGSNNLRVVFKSAVLYGQSEAKKLPYTLPEEERIYSRKAQFQFGWDFAPRFVGCGIWKPVKLYAWNDLKINSVRYKLVSLVDSIAKLEFIVESNCEKAGQYDFSLNCLSEATSSDQLAKKSEAKKLKAGLNTDTLKFSLPQPKLWWCNGMGESFMYDFAISIKDNKKNIQAETLSVGIRTLELVKEFDETGVSFKFILNSVPVFMKGANYVPGDVFLREKSNADILAEINLAKSSHMNMLRVWGGGIYQDDRFYEACDKAGILVWQDLMFACAMYPGDTAFINNVKEEIKEQFIRIRNHPSLAMWCGNNEIEEAWNNWGWQKQFKYSSQDSSQIWKNYLNLFLTTATELILTYDPERPYWLSSPSIGWGHKESLTQGDSHYWGVWWGMEPFEMYQKKSGRFMSEYGFQSMPAFSSFKKFCPDSQLYLNSKSVKLHQKHPKGYETIQTYMERDYKIPTSFENYIYVSQLLQRDGMKMAIETHRRNKPVCMGTLFWQMNDCWPLTSWSALDYYKEPKAFYFALKDLYNSQAISVSETDTSFVIFVISDSIANYGAKLNLKLLNFKSELLWQKNYPLSMSNSKVFKLRVPKRELPLFDSTTSYIRSEVFSMGKSLASNISLLTQPKNLALPKAKVEINSIDMTTIELSADVFTKDVFLYDENGQITFSDNYFNIEAGQKKRIHISSKDKKANFSTIKIKTLNNL